MNRALAALALVLPAAAASGMDLREAQDYVALEHARCSSWFLIMREVASRSFPPGLDRNLAMAQQQELSELAFRRSAETTTRERALERSKAALQDMMDRMQHKLENLPAIADDYAFSCKALIDEPQSRLQYWLDRK